MPVRFGQTFDGDDGAALGLHGQHVAAFDRRAVHVDGAGAALRGVAATVGAGEAQRVAQEVREQCARLNLGADGFTVDGH